MHTATDVNYPAIVFDTQKPVFISTTPDESINTIDFHLPPELEAGQPPEIRGLGRDEVRLMVSYRQTNRIVHTQFRNLPDFLDAGDLVVINTSGTLNAAINATRADGTPLEVHLSTRLPANLWIVEIRQPDKTASRSFFQVTAGETLTLSGQASITLLTPHHHTQHSNQKNNIRLWIARLHLPKNNLLNDYLNSYGFPIRYSYVNEQWPIDYYQTTYATEPGSAEMPSAGRAFTPELITKLVAKGVQIAPLILHTGVASLESHEPPYEEYYRVPSETTEMVNAAHKAGRRIVAVGTTVVRALESVTGTDGHTHAGEGWTDLVITADRRMRAVNAMLTGLHEPKATHLAMLQALAGLEHLQITYNEALQKKYLWHEFGDLHLIL